MCCFCLFVFSWGDAEIDYRAHARLDYPLDRESWWYASNIYLEKLTLARQTAKGMLVNLGARMEQRPHDPNSLRTDSEGYITAWMLQRGIPGSNQFATTFNVSSMVNNVLLLNSVCRDMLHLINRALQRKKHLSALLHCFGHFVTLRPNNSITLARRCYKEQRFRTSFTIGFQKWIIPCEEISEPCPRRSSSWTIRRGTRNIPRCLASVDR